LTIVVVLINARFRPKVAQDAGKESVFLLFCQLREYN